VLFVAGSLGSLVVPISGAIGFVFVMMGVSGRNCVLVSLWVF
jgi:hypothetical protein